MGRGLSIFIVLIVMVPLVFGLFFTFWPEYQRSQLIKNGVAASGTILSIQPTGTTVNDQPQVSIHLNIEAADGEVFEADTTMIINPVYLTEFQPGKHVQVKYDPDDKTKVAIEETETGLR